MSDHNKQVLVATAKEGLRIGWMAAVAAVLAWGKTKLTGGAVGPDWVLVGTGVYKLLDYFVHKNQNINLTGLTPSILQK